MTLAKPEAIPSYRYSSWEKLRWLGPCLRQRFTRKPHLIAGPFAGEFGYELMQWQGYVRARRPLYSDVHVISFPGREYLYEGCQFYAHDIPLAQAGYGYGLLSSEEARRMATAKAVELGLDSYDIFFPPLLCTTYHKRLFWRQDFRLFNEPALAGGIREVAFHFRAVCKPGPDQFKNYQPALADELAALCRRSGWATLCVGHPEYSYCPPGCEDLRSVDLRRTVGAICSARLVVGENSGPMHLANLCGRPTVIWARDRWRVEYSLRWNPFQVPIHIAADDTHQPAPALIHGRISAALAELRKPTGEFRQGVYRLPALPISPY